MEQYGEGQYFQSLTNSFETTCKSQNTRKIRNKKIVFCNMSHKPSEIPFFPQKKVKTFKEKLEPVSVFPSQELVKVIKIDLYKPKTQKPQYQLQGVQLLDIVDKFNPLEVQR